MKNDKKTDGAFKPTIWYLVCDFITHGIYLITMPIFTRMMTTGEIGKYSIMNSWISILSVVITLNLIPSIFLAKYDYEEDYQGFISTVASLGVISASLCYFIIIPFKEVIAKLIQMDTYALDIMAVHLIFVQMTGILLAKFRANLEYKKSVALTLVVTCVITITSVVFTMCYQDALKGRIIGTYLPNIIINIILYIYILSKRKTFKIAYCKYALMICLPLIIHNLAGNIMHSSDKVMIGRLCSDKEAGLYGVAYTCAMFSNVLRNSMISAWNPWVFDRLNAFEMKQIKKASYSYLLIFLFLCVCIIFFAPEILFVLGGEAYKKAIYVVPPVVAAYMFSMVYSLYAGIEQYYKKQKYFAVVAIICAVLNITLNYIFIPIFGYIAAAYTTLISTILECFLHYINVKNMQLTYIYNTKFNLVILFVVLIISNISTIVYKNDLIRYLIICIGMLLIIFVVIIKKDTIKNLVDNVKQRII